MSSENNAKVNENVVGEFTEVVDVPAQVEETTEKTLVELKSSSLQHFPEDIQQAIIALSDSIDVTQVEKVMSYGHVSLLKVFEKCGDVLKGKRGSAADIEVINLVKELSKQAKESYDDYALELKEPNLLQKFLLNIFSKVKDKGEEASIKAISCFMMLVQLRDSSAEWIKMLENSYAQIMESAVGDKEDAMELEQYIVAGRIAEERIGNELVALQTQYETTGLIEDKDRYEMVSEGLEIFRTVLLNLEKSRGNFAISLAQLKHILKTNRNIQIAVRSQHANSMAVAAQQIRNALFDYENRIALEGQKSVTRLNDELLKKVASNVMLTAEESEKLLASGVYTVEAALVAAKTVIDGCAKIEQAKEQTKQVMATELTKLQVMLDELSPFVEDVKQITEKNGTIDATTSKSQGLVF